LTALVWHAIAEYADPTMSVDLLEREKDSMRYRFFMALAQRG
jgi:hypothetical protein